MQIGNLSHHSSRTRGTTLLQMLRVLVVIGIAAAGGLGVTLSLGDGGSSSEAADKTQASQAHSLAQADQTTPVQIADADPSAPVEAQAGSQGSALDATPVDTIAGQAAPPDGAGAAPQALETEHAGAADTQASDAPAQTGAVTVAGIPSDAAQGDDPLVDLNTASLEELKAVPNAGPVARAIIKARPYASVEDLVKRRIIRRSVYEKIKDQVTVR